MAGKAAQCAGIGKQGLRAAIELRALAQIRDRVEVALFARLREALRDILWEAANLAQSQTDRGLCKVVLRRGESCGVSGAFSSVESHAL